MRSTRTRGPGPVRVHRLLCLLRPPDEGCENETDRENEREPTQPHEHLAWDGWRGV